ncbi:MAG: Uma2 family endonuclease [Chloroflexi bacterium]|nr:Uma2 family endonuclease [Chloroflexota bacterium]MCI0580666.1 Uma2 family endonuclease [Chloroflexota bacterium]MCI0648682.1 Uma2 family endonuclease [Chloroflexota bacterium]MCI0728090.1 Uma2 family endonuclease [Chloroflexota bacterium]
MRTELQAGEPPLVLRMEPVIQMTDDEFFAFCQINRDLRIERTAGGEIIVMAPASSETGRRNAKLIISLGNWAEDDGTGIVFDSSAGFILPNGATRAPDASWVRRSRLVQLTPRQKKQFLPLCPDFVVELRSPSDRLQDVQAKMDEYMANGAQLGWLIDPVRRRVYVYRPDTPMTHLQNPATISGEPLLPGFILDLEEIWQPGF